MAKDSEKKREGAQPLAELIDLERYDLESLQNDIVELVDLPEAVMRAAAWVLGVAALVGIFTWLNFNNSMAAWALIPFTLIAVGLSLVFGAALAVYVITRRRMEEATQAANRVLDTIGMAQSDLERLAAGEVTLSVRDLSTEVLESAVFPGLEQGIVQTVPWPLTYLMRPIVWVPRNIIQKTVIAVVERLPIEALGRTVTTGETEVDEVGRLRTAVASFTDDISDAQSRLEQTAQTAIAATSKLLVGVMVISALPLLIWLLIGDVVA